MARRRQRPAVDAISNADAAALLCATEVPLRNGGKIVLESMGPTSELGAERAEVEAYLARASTWFRHEFDQLELFENDIASVAHRKMATFAQLTMTPEWMAPAKIEMRYAPPTARRGSSHRGAGAITAEATSSAPFAAALPASPALPAIVGDTYVLPATLSRRTIASAITGAQERGEAWDSDPAALVVFMRDGARRRSRGWHASGDADRAAFREPGR